MESLCVADACSLIYLSDLEIAGKSLHSWLWDEFPVTYSSTVWDELGRHRRELGRDGKTLLRNGKKNIWKNSKIPHYERAIFANSTIEFAFLEDTTGVCRKCNQAIYRKVLAKIDITSDVDKGERHNCCVAVDAINLGKYQQVIFLTDDYKAVSKYVKPIFDTVPIGSIWSSHDFIVYLFLRHRNRIPIDTAIDTLRDLNANIAPYLVPAQSLIQRFRIAVERINKIAKMSG